MSLILEIKKSVLMAVCHLCQLSVFQIEWYSNVNHKKDTKAFVCCRCEVINFLVVISKQLSIHASSCKQKIEKNQ